MAVVFLLLSAAPGSAATAINWADTSGNTAFTVGVAWNGGTAPANDLTTNTAVVGSVVSAQPNLDTLTRSVAGIDFQLASGGANFTSIASATMTIGASGLNASTQTSGTSTVAVSNITIGVAQTWAFFTATASGTGTMSISSNINLNATNLTIQSKVATGASGKGIVNLSGSISGATGATGLILQGGSSSLNTFNITGVNSYTGLTKIQANTVVVNSLANAGTNSALGQSGDITLGGASSQAALVFSGLAGNSMTDRLLRGENTGNFTLTNNDTNNFAVTFTNTGTMITSGGSAATLTLSGTSTGANSFAELINDRGVGIATNITKSGTGTWILNGNSSTYTGTTTVSGGVLGGTTAHAFGNSASISVAAAGTLSLRGDADTSFTQTSGAAYTISPSASGATINVDQATTAGTAAKTMSIGVLSSGSSAATFGLNFTGANNTSLAIGSVTGPASSTAGTVTLTNSITGGGSLQLGSYTSANSAGGESLAFSGNGNTIVTGTINPSASTALAVTKNGTGSLTLGGANGFSGSLTINGGSVIAANASAISSAAGSTVTIKSTTSLVVGAATATSGQTINVASSIALNSGGSLVFDIFADSHNTGSTRTNTADNDCILLTGSAPTLTLSGTLKVLNPNALGGSALSVGDRFWLLNWDNASTTPVFSGSPTFDLTSFTSSGVTFDTSQFQTAGYIQITAVPEPGRGLLGLLGFTLVVGSRCHRRLGRIA